MRRKISLVLAAAIAAASLAGCGGSKPAAEGTQAESKNQEAGETKETKKTEEAGGGQESGDPIKVVYLVNGNLGDKGFYDSAASGIKMMEEKLGAETKIIEMGRDETSYEGNYLDVSEQDWDMIISGTWSVKELAEEIGRAHV